MILLDLSLILNNTVGPNFVTVCRASSMVHFLSISNALMRTMWLEVASSNFRVKSIYNELKIQENNEGRDIEVLDE